MRSGSGSREGGILIMLRTTYFAGLDIKHAELHPGRLLHLRICSDPAIDLLGVYQHAWNLAKAEFQHQQQTPEQLLIERRQLIWTSVRGWINSIPKRNLMTVVGDFNASLEPSHPNIGKGVGHAHAHKNDGQALQALIQTAGLNAANTWGRSGQSASTFWTHKGEGSQIHYVLLRNPCNLASLRCGPLPNAPIIHPTGFRRIPVQCFLTWPKPPRSQTQSEDWTASQIDRVCKKHPRILEQFRSALQQTTCAAEQLDSRLREAWQQCQPASIKLPIKAQQHNQICLKAFWEAKRSLRAIADRQIVQYGISNASGAGRSVAGLLGASRLFVQQMLQGWQSAARFQSLQSAVRKRSAQARKEKIEKQIEDALEADEKGLTYLYKCMNTMRPKNPKRGTHIKTQDGRLQGNASELDAIRAYFSNVFSSEEPPVLPDWPAGLLRHL